MKNSEKSVLVLGASGFLGSGVCEELCKCEEVSRWKSVDVDESADVKVDLSKTSCVKWLVDELADYREVVLLAAKLGARLFESEQAEKAAAYNQMIFDNVVKAIKKAAKKYKHSYSITFYSTSEVFGSQEHIDDFISESTPVKFDMDNPRHFYAFQKWNAEKTLFNLKQRHPEVLEHVKIIRPFNIYGMKQQRGVLFEMVRSAVFSDVISYTADTTRTMTSIDTASKAALDVILADEDAVLNVADEKCSVTMKQLARIVADVVSAQTNRKYTLIELPHDRSIQYRTVSNVAKSIRTVKRLMKTHITGLYLRCLNEYLDKIIDCLKNN